METHKDEDEDEIGHGPAMIYTMTMEDVNNVLAATRATCPKTSESETTSSKAVERSTQVAMRLCELQKSEGGLATERKESVVQRIGRLKATHTVQTDQPEAYPP